MPARATSPSSPAMSAGSPRRSASPALRPEALLGRVQPGHADHPRHLCQPGRDRELSRPQPDRRPGAGQSRPPSGCSSAGAVSAAQAGQGLSDQFLFYADNVHLTSAGFAIVGHYAVRQLEAPLQLAATVDARPARGEFLRVDAERAARPVRRALRRRHGWPAAASSSAPRRRGANRPEGMRQLRL